MDSPVAGDHLGHSSVLCERTRLLPPDDIELWVLHVRALNALERYIEEGDVPNMLLAIKDCQEFIERGAECSRFICENQAAYTLIGNPWPAAAVAPLGKLFEAYLATGQLRLNDQVDAFGTYMKISWTQPGMTLLEGAIRRRRYDLLPLLVRAGERTDLKPLTMPTEPEFSDMLDLLQYWDPHAHAAYVASGMAEQIALAAASCGAARVSNKSGPGLGAPVFTRRLRVGL